MGECARSNKYVKKVHTLYKWDDNEKVLVKLLLNYLSEGENSHLPFYQLFTIFVLMPRSLVTIKKLTVF